MLYVRMYVRVRSHQSLCRSTCIAPSWAVDLLALESQEGINHAEEARGQSQRRSPDSSLQ